MTKQRKADLSLVLLTFCWGVSYYTMDLVLTEMDPFTLNAWRFLGGFAIAAVFSLPRLRKVSRKTMKYAFLIGVSLVFVYIGATFGVKYTSQSNAGFLCAMAVIFTPILQFIVKRVVPERKLFIVILMCVAGIALMTLNEELRIAKGDLLCLMCAFSYAIDLMLTEKAVHDPEVDPFQLGVFQMLFNGIFMLILALIFETPCAPQTMPVWLGTLFLLVFCTGIPTIVQCIAQQYTTPTHVGVIFCLEPVFAGIVAFLFAGEVLLPRAYFGAFLMLAGLILMEVDLPRRKTGTH